MVEDNVPSDLAEEDVDADVLVVVLEVAEDVVEVMSVEVSVNVCRATCINQICFSNLVKFQGKIGSFTKIPSPKQSRTPPCPVQSCQQPNSIPFPARSLQGKWSFGQRTRTLP